MVIDFPLPRAVEEYFVYCLSYATPPRAQELATMLAVPPRRLPAGEMTPAAMIKAYQILFAKAMLRCSTLSTTRIAYGLGFGTRRTFFRAFRRATGMTPRGLPSIDVGG
jgi:AraC-like DNA-binding protein